VSGGLHREATQSSPAPAEASWTIARLVPSWISDASESAPRPMTMHHDLPRFAAIVERASLVLNATEPCVLRPAPKDTGVLQTDAIEDWAFCKPSRIVFTARHMMATRAAIFLHLARSLRSATRCTSAARLAWATAATRTLAHADRLHIQAGISVRRPRTLQRKTTPSGFSTDSGTPTLRMPRI
jgi:hypothetical protein